MNVKKCEYYPCHKVKPGEVQDCTFCYCPLYVFQECGGNYSYQPDGTKDCSACTLPHRTENLEPIVNRLIRLRKPPIQAQQKKYASPEFLARLKTLAKEASPGPWAWEHRSGYAQWITCNNGGDIALTLNVKNAEYVAAVSPDVVLALIEKIESNSLL